MAGVPRDKQNPDEIKERYPYKKSRYGRKWVEGDANYKLTESMIAQVGAMLSLGMPYYQVSEVIGVCTSTFQAWRYKGREDLEANKDTIFARLWISCAGAKSRGIATALKSLIKLVTGYEYTETRIKLDAQGRMIEKVETTKEVQPSLSSIRFFLMNRDPQNWAHDRHTEMTLKLADYRESLQERMGIDPEELSNEITENIVKLIQPPDKDDDDTDVPSRSD